MALLLSTALLMPWGVARAERAAAQAAALEATAADLAAARAAAEAAVAAAKAEADAALERAAEQQGALAAALAETQRALEGASAAAAAAADDARRWERHFLDERALRRNVSPPNLIRPIHAQSSFSMIMHGRGSEHSDGDVC